MRSRIERVCRQAGYEPPVIYSPTSLWNPTMQTPQTDPIIAEVRAARDEHAARLDYDVEAIFRDIRARQEASDREYVRYPARRTV